MTLLQYHHSKVSPLTYVPDLLLQIENDDNINMKFMPATP